MDNKPINNDENRKKLEQAKKQQGSAYLGRTILELNRICMPLCMNVEEKEI